MGAWIKNDRDVVVLAARRTIIAPRKTALKAFQCWQLAAPLIRNILAETGVQASAIDEVILGNALYGGGNPARLAALAADLPQTVGGLTIDRQCASGLDAIHQGAAQIKAGMAECVIVGGMESYSQRPLRAWQTHQGEGESAEPIFYDRPPFAPDGHADPDLDQAAAQLAAQERISNAEQAAYAVESHRKARLAEAEGQLAAEILSLEDGVSADPFTRRLTQSLCARMPDLAHHQGHGVTAATCAVAADGAACLLLTSRAFAERMALPVQVLLRDGLTRGGNPAMPGLAPVAAIEALLARQEVQVAEIGMIEMMEAYAAQAMACHQRLGLPDARVNQWGGALARGHPIGASGAVLAVRLFHALRQAAPGALGLAAIASAGGLGAASLFARN